MKHHWRLGIAALAIIAAGCGDRLKQGDRVILVTRHGDKVRVDNMPNHRPRDPDRAAFWEAGGRVLDEDVAAGTHASVISDAEPGNARGVKVNLLDPPFDGLSGVVQREDLKRE